MAGFTERHVPGVFLRPRALSLRRFGQIAACDKTTFKDIANGLPGIELRLPLLFSEGVGHGRLDLNQFVALTATNHAKLYGLYPKKGMIAVGSDADIAIWDPERETTITAGMLHDNVGYTPYEDRSCTAGRSRLEPRPHHRRNGALAATRGSGQFLPCALSAFARPAGAPVPEMALAAAQGAALV